MGNILFYFQLKGISDNSSIEVDVKTDVSCPVANSTFKDSVGDMLGSSESDGDSFSVKVSENVEINVSF